MSFIARKARSILLMGPMITLIGGCASEQLNYNTLDLASTTDNLLTAQILHNFANFIDSQAALPAQLSIGSGTATTTNTITPGVSLPLTQTIATTNTLAVTTAAAASSVATGQRVGTVNPISSTISASNVAAQNWAYETITDPYRMHRLAALYRYAVDWSAERNGEALFLNNYPLVQKVVSHNVPTCISGLYKDKDGYKTGSPVLTNKGTAIVDLENGKDDLQVKDLSFCATQSVQSNNYSHTEGTESYSTQIPDDRYVHGAGCIACMDANPKHLNWRIEPKHLHINAALAGCWLRWKDITGTNNRAERTPKHDDVPIGRSGHYVFYVDKQQASAFAEFSIAVLAASTVADQPLTGSAGTGAGSNSATGAPKANPLELTLPISTGGT